MKCRAKGWLILFKKVTACGHVTRHAGGWERYLGVSAIPSRGDPEVPQKQREYYKIRQCSREVSDTVQNFSASRAADETHTGHDTTRLSQPPPEQLGLDWHVPPCLY